MGMFVATLSLALLGLVAGGATPGSDKLHEHMTAEEVKQVFNTEPHAVPEYDVVPIHWPRLHKRAYGSSTKIRLNAFGRDVNLWLNPTEGILAGRDTPVYFARSDSSSKIGVTFSRIRDPLTVVGQLFEDKQRYTSMVVKKTANGRRLMSGNVGSEGWVVRPVPDRFSNQLNARYRRSTEDVNDLKNITAGDYEPDYHVIYKNPEVPEEADYITLPLQDDIFGNKTGRSKRSAPGTIYPQILVIADYETYKLHGQNVYSLLTYLVPFWNGVDLRYRSLENPKIRLNIAGVVVASDPDALSFISDHKVSPNTLNIFGALDSLSQYMRTVEQYLPVTSYDIAVAMAPYTMCSPTKQGTCQSGTLGLAYVSGACNVLNYGVPRTLSATVIQDKGGFDGMHTAAHELGHLFGASHDGQGASACSGDDGHIMASTPVLTENSADWSKCSLKAFDKFFNHGDPTCLYDKPKTTSSVPRILPGRFMSVDDQCSKIEGTRACRGNDNMCMRLRCIYKKNSDYCIDVGDAAADGTSCGAGKICLHGKCLFESDIQ